MSKKRGLSVDEKRKIILDIFHESKTVWLLKARSTNCLRSRQHEHAVSRLPGVAGAMGESLFPMCAQDLEKVASKKGVVLQTVKGASPVVASS